MKHIKFRFGVFVFLLVFGFVNHLILASVGSTSKNHVAKVFKAKEISVYTVATPTVAMIPKVATVSIEIIPSSIPIKIEIPSVKISATVKTVGTTSSGNMAVPVNFSDVGWYKYGALPGAVGNTIIAGHYESAVNKSGFVKGGPFQNLSKIKIGDNIYVIGENGKKLHYKVSSKKIYGKDDNTNEIFSQKGESKLVLITCNGTWLPNQKTFSQRLVVDAVLSEDKVK